VCVPRGSSRQLLLLHHSSSSPVVVTQIGTGGGENKTEPTPTREMEALGQRIIKALEGLYIKARPMEMVNSR